MREILSAGSVNLGNYFSDLFVGFHEVQALKRSDPLKSSQIEIYIYIFLFSFFVLFLFFRNSLALDLKKVDSQPHEYVG